MKIVTRDELGNVNIGQECFILKSFFNPALCDEIIDFLKEKLATHQPNERFDGENWHYPADKGHTKFNFFLFDEVRALQSPALRQAFKAMYDLYVELGEEFPFSFEDGIDNITKDGTVKQLNAGALWYPAGTGRFQWHRHPQGFQRTQILINLTNPGKDYTGGFTRVKNGADELEVFDNRVEKGDVLAFPYTRWHSVDPITEGTSELNSRIMLVMPLTPRGVKQVQFADENVDWKTLDMKPLQLSDLDEANHY